jgi:hypothetical protein
LSDWNLHDRLEVRHFSGTATYAKRFDVPKSFLSEGRRVFLDLGEVRVMAEVRLNGEDLGVLWKPPFRVDITGCIRPGTNALEIAVTNLWPNRLIGAEQLAPDVEYLPNGVSKKRPEWLDEGTARPTKRTTLSMWDHYDKEDPLLESGLLGPVMLRTDANRAPEKNACKKESAPCNRFDSISKKASI